MTQKSYYNRPELSFRTFELTLDIIRNHAPYHEVVFGSNTYGRIIVVRRHEPQATGRSIHTYTLQCKFAIDKSHYNIFLLWLDRLVYYKQVAIVYTAIVH